LADLNSKQSKFLLALLKESTTEEAIETAKIARNTAYGYLRDPTFQEALRSARKESVMLVAQQLSSAGNQAVVTLIEIMNDEDAPATSKVSASRTILEYLFRSFEDDEILERIEALEEMQE